MMINGNYYTEDEAKEINKAYQLQELADRKDEIMLQKNVDSFEAIKMALKERERKNIRLEKVHERLKEQNEDVFTKYDKKKELEKFREDCTENGKVTFESIKKAIEKHRQQELESKMDYINGEKMYQSNKTNTWVSKSFLDKFPEAINLNKKY